MTRLSSQFPEMPLRYWVSQPIVNGVGEAAEFDRTDWPRYVRITDIASARRLRDETFKSLPPEIAQCAELRRNDLLFAAAGSVGKSYLHESDEPACFAGYLARIRPASSVCPRFLSYWGESQHFWHQIQSQAVQVTIQNFSAGKYRSLQVPNPPLPTQRAIAAFLDRKTDAIDALIENKLRLLELLREKRLALINQAVTLGRDPNAALMKSDLEWFPWVPGHWTILRLRRACSSIFLGLTSKVDYVNEGGVPLVRALNIAAGVLDFSDARSISGEQHRHLTRYRRTQRDDVLLSKSGSIGTVAIVDTDAHFSIYESIFALRARPSVLQPRFLLATLRGQATQAQCMANLVGMGVTHLNMSDIIDVRIPVPPLDEQVGIAEFVYSTTQRLDRQERLLRRSVDLLREYRQSLITAAVTGQLDIPEAPTP